MSFITILLFFFFNATTTPELYTLSLHDALPISASETIAAGTFLHAWFPAVPIWVFALVVAVVMTRSEEHTSELQSRGHLVCRLLLEKKKKTLISTNKSKTNLHISYLSNY